MSAPAIKSSMPGVGGTPPTTGHSMLPMNMMAQKVVQSSETSAMKPMTGSGISYVTLQPPAQPLSLVQDHRPQVYPAQASTTTPTTNYNVEKETEPETEKQPIPNGLEGTKTQENVEPQTTPVKTVDTVKSNESGVPVQPEPTTQPQVVVFDFVFFFVFVFYLYLLGVDVNGLFCCL